MRKIIFLLVLTCQTLLSQQAPEIKFAVCLGDHSFESACVDYNTSEKDYGLQVLSTPDGGYVLAGETRSRGGYVTGLHGQNPDMWVVKTDSKGNFQWQRPIGGIGFDSAASIALTNDGGYIVAGYASVEGGDVPWHYGSHTFFIAKLDVGGNLQWTKALGSTGNEKAYSVKQTVDGGYIIAGASTGNDHDVSGHHGTLHTYDMWVVKTDPSGNIEWQKSLGGTGDEIGYSVQQTRDGGYIVAGGSISKNNGDVTGNHTYYSVSEGTTLASQDSWVVKLGPTGVIEWQKSLGGTGDDIGYSVQQTNDNGYIVAGTSNSINGDVTGNHGLFDYWVTKLDVNGSIVWQRSFGGSKYDRAYFIRQDLDGGYVVAGASTSIDGDVTDHHGNNTSNDYWVIKLNSSGTLLWSRSLGGTSGDLAYSLDLTHDGGYVVAGTTVFRNGDVTGLHQNSDATDFWLVKLGASHLDSDDMETSEVYVFPNPFKEGLTFSESLSDIEITSLDGKIIYRKKNGIQIDQPGLQPGIYILKGLKKDGTAVVKKIIKN